MLTTDDVVNLFASMRTAYGLQWRGGNVALDAWRRALARFPVEQIHAAANKSLEVYVDHPPTLPQFLQLLRDKRPRSTYLAAPDMDRPTVIGNRVLTAILRSQLGVNRSTLANLVGLKNALADELAGAEPTESWVGDLQQQLEALAANHDQAAKADELERARAAFRRQRGMPEHTWRDPARRGREAA